MPPSHHHLTLLAKKCDLLVLYKCPPLPVRRVARQRWSMLGHVLEQAMEFAVLGASKYKACTEQDVTALLRVLRDDRKQRGFQTRRSEKNPRELRKPARDKTRWHQARD